jgi:shikimate dehydrogenase
VKKILLGLIGSGIQRSLSPALQEEEARHHGLRLHYQLIDLDGAERGAEVLPVLIEAIRVMGFAGFNVTYPCKQMVIPLLDELSEEARAIGAVNGTAIGVTPFMITRRTRSGYCRMKTCAARVP